MSMRLSRSIVGEAEAEAVHRVICEDGYLGIGKEVQQFEADVAAYLGVPASWVISVNTGTAALHLAVEARARARERRGSAGAFADVRGVLSGHRRGRGRPLWPRCAP